MASQNRSAPKKIIELFTVEWLDAGCSRRIAFESRSAAVAFIDTLSTLPGTHARIFDCVASSKAAAKSSPFRALGIPSTNAIEAWISVTDELLDRTLRKRGA